MVASDIQLLPRLRVALGIVSLALDLLAVLALDLLFFENRSR